MGEIVRRAVSQYHSAPAPSADEEEMLTRLTAELRASTRRATAALAQAERDIDSAIAVLRKARAQARRRPTKRAP